MTDVSSLEIVRIIHSLSHIGATTVIPSDVDGIDDVRLAGEERQFEAGGDLGKLHGIFRRKRLLALCDGFPLAIARKNHGLRLKFWQAHGGELGADLGSDTPEDGAAEKFVKFRLIPATHVVAISRVENLALALITDPCPRLFVTKLEDFTAIGKAVVHVSFIPRLEACVSPHDRVIFVGDGGAENLATVRFETATDQLDKLRRAPEAGRSAMNRQKGTAGAHISEKRRLLGGVHGFVLLPVCVEHHAIIAVQDISADIGKVFRVSEADAIHSKCFFKNAVALDRIVGGAVHGGCTEEENLHMAALLRHPLGILGEADRHGKNAERNDENFFHGLQS